MHNRMTSKGIDLMILMTIALAVTACRGDGDYGDDDDGDGGSRGGCQFECVAEYTDCGGRIVEGDCPDDGLCCNPTQGGRDTGNRGNDTGEGNSYEEGECQFECVDFIECPMNATVDVQTCEDPGQVCCDMQ